MTFEELQVIRAHTAHNLRVIPQSVDLNDKRKLLAEIDRLQAAVEEIARRDAGRADARELIILACRAAAPLSDSRI